jgi:hypothetical protein
LSDNTSLLDSEAANTALTASYQESSAFTPGVITIDGIAVKIALVAAGTPSNTISVRLAQGGSTVLGTEVTINVSDLPSCAVASNEGGWVLFKFVAPVLLVVATAYTVSAKLSATSTAVNLYSSATTNWSRQLRTTDVTTTPTTGTTFDVIGEHTGAGTGNDITVVMDNTATTDFGAGTDGVVALTVSKRGSLKYAYSASTAYYLKLSGDLIVYNGGTLTVGDTTNPIPRTSTAVLEFDPVADGGMGLIARNGSTVTIQGLSRTSGKNIVACKLNTDEAANSTSLGVDTDTGWLDNDVIVAGKTTRSTSTLTETGTMNGDAAAAILTVDGFGGVGGGIVNARSGTSPIQCHIGLLTRNIMFRSATSTLMTYMNVKATATVDIDWCDFRYIGKNTTSKKGIEIETTTGSFSLMYSTIRDTEEYSLVTTGTTTNNITISYNNFYNCGTNKTASIDCFSIATTSGTNITITYNRFFLFQLNSTNQYAVRLLDLGLNFSNNVINDTNTGAALNFGESATIGTSANNEISCTQNSSAIQVVFNFATKGTISSMVVFRGTNQGVQVLTNTLSTCTFINCSFFGNTNGGFVISSGLTNCDFNTCTFAADIASSQTHGIKLNGSNAKLRFNTCTFGGSSPYANNSTADIGAGGFNDEVFDNCTFNSNTLIATYIAMPSGSIVAFNKYNTITNKHYWYTPYGIAQSTGAGLTDTNVRTAGSLGLRIAPEDSTTGFSWSFKILAKASTYVGVAGFIQKNAAFGTSVCTAELFLPGSTTADATQTMPNDTNWNVFNLAANYTGSVDLYATVTITAKTATAGAYIYVDDIYNGTNKITALDVWDQGQPSPIMFEQLGDAAAVWAVLQSTQTTPGTMGNRLSKALTLPLFLALK